MVEGKLNNSILCISLILVVIGIGNIILKFEPEEPEYCCGWGYSGSFVVGTLEGPSDLDPVLSWDSASNDVIEQVCEGLYQYNLSDPDLGIIPMLAADYGTWNPTATKLTIPLRQGVLFHDGTEFNASSVRWTFERINYFINASGMPWILNETVSKIHSLYEFPNGTTILDPVNPVTINSKYSVTINLRGSYAILESLLCYVTAYMLSPASTSQFEYIDRNHGDLVGTGPFVYDYYYADTEVNFHRWENYWREPAYFGDVTFAVINDATTRNNAMLGHTIDYLIGSMSSLFPTFDADPTIIHRAGGRALSYYYLGMNNKRINQTWRQAISYGINYTHITEELQDGTVFRSNGPLAPNFPGYDPNIQAATYNLTKAREVVISMGFGDIGWTDAQWQAAEFAVWNYTYNIGNDFREDILLLLQDNLDLIGITIIDQGMSWADFIYRAYGYMEPGGYDSLMLYWVGWGPDYLSPFNMIAPLFSNKSTSNAAQYWNHDVEMWLEQILREPDATKRQMLYLNILYQIVEVDMPHAFGYHPYQHSVHSADIHGVPYNALGSFYVYPMYRGTHNTNRSNTRIYFDKSEFIKQMDFLKFVSLSIGVVVTFITASLALLIKKKRYSKRGIVYDPPFYGFCALAMESFGAFYCYQNLFIIATFFSFLLYLLSSILFSIVGIKLSKKGIEKDDNNTLALIGNNSGYLLLFNGLIIIFIFVCISAVRLY